jgi:hypothetical protein
MKRENLKRSVQLTDQLKAVDEALDNANEFLTTKTKDNFGYECGGKESVYSFRLNEYKDGSGMGVDLTNCGISIEIVKFTKTLLEKRKKIIISEIESL